MYHILADMHGWTPEQVDNLPAEFLYEHLERNRARRSVNAMKARRKWYSDGRGEEADISEIV